MVMITHSAVDAVQAVETPFADSRCVVMKFGGRSVSTVENWGRIRDLLRARVDEGLTPVVCHSALAGVSNALISLLDGARRGEDTQALVDDIIQTHVELAQQLGVDASVLDTTFDTVAKLVAGVGLVGEVSPGVHARVLAAGELAATLLGTAYLRSQGLDVEWLDARTLLQSSTLADQSERSAFLSARCEFSADGALQARLAASSGIIVTQGFIARNEHGDTVLLGRGGSDTTGSYLASKLQARRLEIWTDVPGFFSADPGKVPSARLIRSLHYQEAQEIASAGGGILHPRSISPVRSSGIPLFIKWTSRPEAPGTAISSAVIAETPQLKAVSHRGGLTLVSMESLEMWHQVGFLAEAFGVFRKHGLSVDLISTSESNVTVSIDTIQNVADEASIDALAADLGRLCRVKVLRDCAAITLVGRRIRAILHELTSVLEVFEEQKVHLVTQSATDLNLTFVVDSEHAYRLVQRLHGLLVHRFEGSVFGETWEEISGAAGPGIAHDRPVPWWRKRASELVEIGHEHGAAYVYDRGCIESALSRLQELRSVDAVFYAMKANFHPDILRIVYESGANFECVSPGEIRRVLELFPDLARERILFTPNFAGRDEYAWGLDQGVWLTIDNLFVLREWHALFADREIFIRIDTGQGRGHHEHVRTAGVHAKFGVPLFEIDELAALTADCGARVVGLHAHTGSGVLVPDAWRLTAEQLIGLTDRFPDVRFLDIGGGLGIPEKPGQGPLDLAALDAGLGELRASLGGRELWLEPGRFIVAEAGVLLAEVTQTKGKGDVQYIGVRTGMNSLIRPALYGAYHEIVNISRLEEAATEIVTVVGPICETGDRLGSDRLMPKAAEGDILLIANTGAYGQVMSSQYNLRDRVAEIIV